MPSANLRDYGTTAQFAPVIKRATATLSDQSVVMIVPDTNIASMGGTDVTGTAKLHFYKSDTTRTTWSLNVTFTLSPVSHSTTVAAVMSMVLDSSNNMHLVYQGTDNSLNYRFFTFGSGTWTLTTSQTVAAANAVTNRYRAVDIDVTSTNRPAIIVYESKASAGPSAWTRVYIRNDDGTTWRKAYEDDHASYPGGSLPIYQYSEDVSISWNAAGITSNVGQLLVYYTRTAAFYDRGDVVRELQYNVNTGTDNSATVLGSWPTFNQDVGAATRRGWIFKTTNNLWQVAMVAGLAKPKFMTMRLTHNSFSAPIIDKTVNIVGNEVVDGVSKKITLLIPQIDRTANAYNAIGCVYADNRVMFGFVTSNTLGVSGGASGFTLSSIVFRYNDASTFTASYIDSQMRPLDDYFNFGTRPIGVYGGGNNRNQSGDLKFNFMGLYGDPGNGTSFANKVRAIIDTFYDAPIPIGPSSTSPNNTPILQVRVQNSALYPNIKGKIEWTLARNAAFTTDARTITEPDANYRYFGSTTAAVPPPVNVSLQLNGVGSQDLYSGLWYMRSRVVSDLGQVSAWSTTTTFTVSHAPTALPSSPSQGSFAPYLASGNIFSWTFNDTEPTDLQTAYQLVIVRLDTGATVLDTGKVVSSLNSVTTVLATTLKDIQMQWTVSLWDTDDIQGPFSNPVLFTVGDAPLVRVTSPTSGATVSTAAPLVGWAFTGGGSRTQKAYRVTAYETDLLDLFTRSVSNGFGTSTDGKTWTVDLGAASVWSTNGSAGVVSLAAIETRYIIKNNLNLTDTEQYIEFSFPVTPTGGSTNFYFMARYIDSNNYYRARAEIRNDGILYVGIERVLGGVITTPTGRLSTGITYATGTTYIFRARVIGSRISCRIAVKNSGEADIWQVEHTDDKLMQPGGCGLEGIINTGNTNTLPYVINFDNYYVTDLTRSPVGDSKWIQSTVVSHQFDANIFSNNEYYKVDVATQDTAGLRGYNSLPVVTVWTPPVDGSSSVVTDNFGATISWTNSGIDINFVGWRVYRRYMVPSLSDLDSEDTASTWVLIYETSVNQSNYSYKDYLIPLNKSVDYVVVQVADRFGSLIESPISSFSTVTCTANRYYFIPTVPIGTIASYEAGNVIDDSYTDEIESQILHVIGRGRQVQVGDDLGVTGTLTIQLRNPTGNRPDREFIQRLASSKNLNLWMKNPFGDVKCVKFLSVQVKLLAGTGVTEMSDLSVPYVEVFTDVPITRS